MVVKARATLPLPTFRSWLDIRRSNPDHEKLLALMDARVKVQADKGCDAIEYDNVDVCLQTNNSVSVFPDMHVASQ
jgi:hypothetical protein